MDEGSYWAEYFLILTPWYSACLNVLVVYAGKKLSLRNRKGETAHAAGHHRTQAAQRKY